MARRSLAAFCASPDEDLAIGQQRGRVVIARGRHRAGRRPGTASRVVQLRTANAVATAVTATGDEYLAGQQQRRNVALARG